MATSSVPTVRPVRVVLADDHPCVRMGLSYFLEHTQGIEVVGQAADGEQAIRLVTELQPDVLILDIAMPDLSGLQVARQLLNSQPDLYILILSAYESEAYVREAVDIGVAGYVLKDETWATIALAVLTVAQGEAWLSPRVAAQVMKQAKESKPRLELSAQESGILQLMAEGKTDKEIGQSLGMAERTVRYHLRKIYNKLGVRTRAEAIAKFCKNQ